MKSAKILFGNYKAIKIYFLFWFANILKGLKYVIINFFWQCLGEKTKTWKSKTKLLLIKRLANNINTKIFTFFWFFFMSTPTQINCYKVMWRCRNNHDAPSCNMILLTMKSIFQINSKGIVIMGLHWLQRWRLATLLKRNSGSGVFLRILDVFQKRFFIKHLWMIASIAQS